MVNTQDLKFILESDEFNKDLQDLSSYAANIRQERPIVILLTKHLWQRGYNVALEKQKCDLVVGKTRIEFKFSFDCDSLSLEKELKRFDGNLEILMNAVTKKEISPTWTVSPAIYKDVIEKRPEIFVWILCKRELSELSDEALSRTCISLQQKSYNRNRPYESNQEFPKAFEELLMKLQKFRNFSLETIPCFTNKDFPSVYYFMICEFTEA